MWSNLAGANLTKACLAGSRLSVTHLSSANLTEADLTGADITRADLTGANLNKAYIGQTVFAAIDLSTVKRLESVIHDGPSTVGIDTIYKSKGNIPELFPRGCGVPEEFITYTSGPLRAFS